MSELVATVARLADPTWSAAPPGLREKVLGQVSQTRQVRPGSARRGTAVLGALGTQDLSTLTTEENLARILEIAKA